MTTIAPASIGIAVAVGLATGVHTATWGMYKDAMYEGFSARKYARSVAAGAVSAVTLQLLMRFDLRDPAGLLMLFGLAYVLERGLVEFHKSFVREEDQSKYFIPMAFAIGGRVVTDRRVRTMAGIAYAATIGLVIAALAWGERVSGTSHSLATLLLIGSAGGWISALGGAWKDAPKEGFQVFKFFRSPAVSFAYALALSALTTSWLVIAFGALGFTIATIETHKMFDTAHVRGKFAGKPVRYPETLQFRRRFVPIFLGVWLLVIATFVATFLHPRSGLLASIGVPGIR